MPRTAKRRYEATWDDPAAGQSTRQDERDAGADLLKMFLHLYSVVKLSAADFCILCHLCAKAGVKGGAFSVYAQGPDRPSGQYQRHLDSVLPGPGPLYWVPIPMQQKRSNRAVRDVPFRAGFECLRREVESTPALLQTLDSDPADRKQNVLDVPIYKSHPLVQKKLLLQGSVRLCQWQSIWTPCAIRP